MADKETVKSVKDTILAATNQKREEKQKQTDQLLNQCLEEDLDEFKFAKVYPNHMPLHEKSLVHEQIYWASQPGLHLLISRHIAA